MSELTITGQRAGRKTIQKRTFLPREARLDMPDQDFGARVTARHQCVRRGYWIPRAALFAGTAVLTAAFGYELYSVLGLEQLTPIQCFFLVLSTVAFGWIALGSLSAALGFLPLVAGEKADTIALPAEGPLKERTALLFPVYNERPSDIAGIIQAVAFELNALGRADSFDVFVLSDTRDEGAAKEEWSAYGALARRLQKIIPVYYRRRDENHGRKSGNIKDWVRRFGAKYEHFVILDADSVMSGATLVRLARAMESDEKAGLIQTVPRLTGAETLLQYLQQYAANIYGPTVAAGLAVWHRDQGNYWGHNAILRTRAFASAAGLPTLPGPAPFGGHIQSHDFVEAVLLARAGWGVHIVPAVEGSYEGQPPTLPDVIARDRRWAQGNLQHLSIVRASGLTAMGRLHLVMGATSYLVSAIWALSLIVGVVLALQGQQMIPSYFIDKKTLFPVWPVIDSGAALRLLFATMIIVLLPKILGLVLELKRVRQASEPLGSVRAVIGVVTETVFSILIAPILMVTQTIAVFQVLLGFDSGWGAQRRDSDGFNIVDAVRCHYRHTLVGAVLAFACYEASPQILAWMSPVIVGLLLSVPLSWFMGKRAGASMRFALSTPDVRTPPAIVESARRARGEWADAAQAAEAPQDPEPDGFEPIARPA